MKNFRILQKKTLLSHSIESKLLCLPNKRWNNRMKDFRILRTVGIRKTNFVIHIDFYLSLSGVPNAGVGWVGSNIWDKVPNKTVFFWDLPYSAICFLEGWKHPWDTASFNCGVVAVIPQKNAVAVSVCGNRTADTDVAVCGSLAVFCKKAAKCSKIIA